MKTHFFKVLILREDRFIWRIIDGNNFVLSLPIPLAPPGRALFRGYWTNIPIRGSLLALFIRREVRSYRFEVRLRFLRVKAARINTTRLWLATFACKKERNYDERLGLTSEEEIPVYTMKWRCKKLNNSSYRTCWSNIRCCLLCPSFLLILGVAER